MNPPATPTERVRLDKWLWAARFFKTRSLSADEIGKGRVNVNDQAAKASREVRVGDRIELRQGQVARTVVVKAARDQRGSAVVAQTMFEETPESIAQRTRQALERRLTVFLTLLEPVMILVMGGVVLMIVLAILLPIIEINQLVH